MKHIYKLTPVSMYDAQGLESWLEDMAKRGLFLKKFGSIWCSSSFSIHLFELDN